MTIIYSAQRGHPVPRTVKQLQPLEFFERLRPAINEAGFVFLPQDMERRGYQLRMSIWDITQGSGRKPPATKEDQAWGDTRRFGRIETGLRINFTDSGTITYVEIDGSLAGDREGELIRAIQSL
jgi:hypothetical protein